MQFPNLLIFNYRKKKKTQKPIHELYQGQFIILQIHEGFCFCDPFSFENSPFLKMLFNNLSKTMQKIQGQHSNDRCLVNHKPTVY